MAILNSFVNDIFERIATEASSKPHPCPHLACSNHACAFVELASYSKKSTISSREIQTAVRLILPGELAKHAISEGTKSVTKVSQFCLSRKTISLTAACCLVLQRWCQVNYQFLLSCLLIPCVIVYHTSNFTHRSVVFDCVNIRVDLHRLPEPFSTAIEHRETCEGDLERQGVMSSCHRRGCVRLSSKAWLSKFQDVDSL